MRLVGWHGRTRPGVVCQQWVEIVTDYLEGAPAELRQAADRHLADCPPCHEYLRQMHRTMEISGRLRYQDVPQEVVDALAKAFQESLRGR